MSDAPSFYVDGSNLVHRLYHALPDYTRVFDHLRRWLGAIRATHTPAELRIAFDTPGNTWRHELCPGYKANRSEKPPELVHLLETASAALKSWPTSATPGYEADDLLAAWSHADAAAGRRAVLVTADKDLYQCLRPGSVVILKGFQTSAGRITGHKWETYETFVERFGLAPPQWPHYRALVGDKSDGMSGVQGIGPDAARKLLSRFATIDESIEALERFATTDLTRLQERNLRVAHKSGDLEKWVRIHTLQKTVPEPAECN